MMPQGTVTPSTSTRCPVRDREHTSAKPITRPRTLDPIRDSGLIDENARAGRSRSKRSGSPSSAALARGEREGVALHQHLCAVRRQCCSLALSSCGIVDDHRRPAPWGRSRRTERRSPEPPCGSPRGRAHMVGMPVAAVGGVAHHHIGFDVDEHGSNVCGHLARVRRRGESGSRMPLACAPRLPAHPGRRTVARLTPCQRASGLPRMRWSLTPNPHRFGEFGLARAAELLGRVDQMLEVSEDHLAAFASREGEHCHRGAAIDQRGDRRAVEMDCRRDAREQTALARPPDYPVLAG